MSATAEETASTSKQIVEDAMDEFTRAKDRLMKDLGCTPDDKINWSPGSSARTPIQQVAHAAMSLEGILKMFGGEPFPFENISEMDATWRRAEKQFTTREQATGLLEKNCAAYIAWLDTLTPEQIESTFKTPFGEFPMAAAVTFAADHLRNHAAQIEYIQTCYGDLDWHL